MRLLLDTHVLLGLGPDRLDTLAKPIAELVFSSDHSLSASVVSLWEIVLKWRIGKLDLAVPPIRFVEYWEAAKVTLLPLDREHVLAELTDVSNTRDPFDRLLLAICQVEGLRLLTRDRALAAHPLAFRS